MAFVAVRPLPPSSCMVQRHGLGLRLGRHFTGRVAVPALRPRCPSVRCNAEEGGAEEKKAVGLHSQGVSVNEEFGGWDPSVLEEEPDGSWKAGALRVGAGFVLAIGVSLASYSWYQKQGKKFAPSPPPQAAIQKTQETQQAPPEQETPPKTSLLEPDYSDDDVTFDELSKKDDDDDDDFDGELEKDSFTNKLQDIYEGKKQDASNQDNQAPPREADQLDSAASKLDVEPPSLQSEGKASSIQRNRVESAGTQGKEWKIVVPAVVDRMQELAIAALQALKVVEDEVDPGAVCTRRNYARWLIATSSKLTRSSANKVFPAMYIDEEAELAFDDISPDDPDFPYIQGLAEAGLIPSNLSDMDTKSSDWTQESESGGILFLPDSPLSRQDLVSWRIALDRRSLTAIDKEDFQIQSGFKDVDRIDSRVWPAIISDLYSGESSIIASAFGFTRMFQPQKPATNGQAAIALASGDTAEQLGEELARLEAERMAEEAVTADAAMEARAQKSVKALFDGELETERKQREEAEKLLEEVKAELEKVKEERESEKNSILTGQAAVEAQKNLLHETQQKVDEQLQALSMLQVEVSYEKERLEKLTAKAEEDQQSASRLKFELDSEMKALVLARQWAEDEAQKARSQAEILEEARKRWASRGIEVNVDKSFDEDNIPGPSWRYSGSNTELEKLLRRAPMQDVIDRGEGLKTRVNNGVVSFWHALLEVLQRFYQRIMELLQMLRSRSYQLSQGTFSSASRRLQDTGSVIAEKLRGAQTSVAGITAGARDGTKRFADGCRGEFEKIAQRFKHD